MADCRQPPLKPCPQCVSTDWHKCVDRVHVALAGKEAHKSVFPITIPCFEKKLVVDENNQPVRDELNRPVVQYQDVTFKSKAEQDAYMKKNDLARTMDGRSPSIGPSQRSFYDCIDTPPTQEAVKMAERAHFVEPRELYDSYGVAV
jgi:hypothetical protein